MTDFKLLDRAMSARNSQLTQALSKSQMYNPRDINERTKTRKEKIKRACTHKDILEENGVKLCTDCGREISREMSFEKEWRWYGRDRDTRHCDPNRCHIRKSDDRTIYNDVAGMGFTNKIIEEANKIYQEVTNGNIYRANSRRAIIFACIWHAYKLQGHPQTCADLMNIFKLERKVGLKGLKHISKKAPKGSPLRITYITPTDFIMPIMSRFNADKKEIDEVTAMCEELKNRSCILNRSRPQSVASGLIYYFCRLKNKNITMAEFIREAELSELTVRKIAGEIKLIRGTPEVAL